MDGHKINGQLMNTDHKSITIETRPEDKKIKPELQEISFDQIKGAFVTVQFGKK